MKEKTEISNAIGEIWKNKDGETVAITCIAYDKKTGNLSRGTSVCSKKDKPNIPKGTKIAINYAKRALKRRPGKRMSLNTIKRLMETDCPYLNHSEILLSPSVIEEEYIQPNRNWLTPQHALLLLGKNRALRIFGIIQRLDAGQLSRRERLYEPVTVDKVKNIISDIPNHRRTPQRVAREIVARNKGQSSFPELMDLISAAEKEIASLGL